MKPQYLYDLLNLICWFSVGENDKDLATFAILIGLMDCFLFKALNLETFLRQFGFKKIINTLSGLFLVIALFPSVKGALCFYFLFFNNSSNVEF